MITFFKMKYAEWKMKLRFYCAVNAVVENQEDIINLGKNLFNELKDVPIDELRNQFITALASVVHESNNLE